MVVCHYDTKCDVFLFVFVMLLNTGLKRTGSKGYIDTIYWSILLQFSAFFFLEDETAFPGVCTLEEFR